MNTHNIKLWKTKLKAAKEEERHWAKMYNEAERHMLRIGREIDTLESKIANELAKHQQNTHATV